MTKARPTNLFGENLKSYRKSLGETRTEFAADCGCSMYTIQNYEIGRNTPNLAAFLQICNVKKVLPSRLLDGYSTGPTEVTIMNELENCLKPLKLSERQRIIGQLDIWINCILNTEPKLMHASFGERIRILRTNASLELRDVADACAISISTLQGYESGQHDPSIPVLLYLCQILQVSPNYLLYPRIDFKVPGDNRIFFLLPAQLHTLLQSAQYLKNNFFMS